MQKRKNVAKVSLKVKFFEAIFDNYFGMFIIKGVKFFERIKDHKNVSELPLIIIFFINF